MGNPYDKVPYMVTDGVILRKIVSSDLNGLFGIYSNENIFTYLPGDVKKNKDTVEHMIGHFERDFNKKKVIFLGICLAKSPDEMIGVAEMFDYDDKVNMITIGYRLNEDFWGQGIAKQAVKAMVDYLFDTVLINRIQAFVMVPNVRSQRVLQKSGFKKEGVLRQAQYWKGKGVVDLEVYSLLRSDL